MIRRKRTLRFRSFDTPVTYMADLGFIAIFFFTITATIPNDKSISVQLAPYQGEPTDTTWVLDRNLVCVYIDFHEKVFVDGQEMGVSAMKNHIKTFIMNPEGSPKYAEKPNKAIVQLCFDRSTAHYKYIEVYDALKASYHELWDEEAQQLGYDSFYRIGDNFDYDYIKVRTIKMSIRNKIPFVLMEDDHDITDDNSTINNSLTQQL